MKPSTPVAAGDPLDLDLHMAPRPAKAWTAQTLAAEPAGLRLTRRLLALAAAPAALVAAGLLVVVGLAACRQPLYDIDRMADPVARARYSCQYLLERALAEPGELDPDGVLRRRVADFAEPQVRRDGAAVHVAWPAGSILRRAVGSRHGGACAITLRDHGARRIDAVTLDGRALHAGFGM